MGSKMPRLAVMMFLHYAVWGLWLPVLGTYLQAPVDDGGLGFTPGQVGWIIALATSLGAFSAPFIAGQLADRYFSTEKFLAFLMLAGGAITWAVAFQKSLWLWFVLMSLYSIIFMPTISLTNSLAFSHMKDPDNDFPKVRVWGTIGWIAASWIFPAIWLKSNVHLQALPPFLAGEDLLDSTRRLADSLKFSGSLAFIYAAYCFFALPHTPPKRDAVEKLAVMKAFALFRKPSFVVLIAASLPIAIIHNIYFIQTGPFFTTVLGLQDSEIGPAMSIGQFAEIGVMVILGMMIKRIGIRWVIVTGAMAYFLRYAIFGSYAFLPVPVIVASQALHGFCFSCFFAAGFIYVDRICSDDIKSSAQTVFGMIILGLGPLLSGPCMGLLEKMFMGDAILNYRPFYYTLAAVGLAAAIGFGALFREEAQSEPAEGAEPA